LEGKICKDQQEKTEENKTKGEGYKGNTEERKVEQKRGKILGEKAREE
jgi:hypothetical protein